MYRSPTLSSEEVGLIERRIQCFQPPRPGDERLQYFQLPNRKVVVSRTVQIEPYAEITDKTQRPGAFLAHCAILSPADFALIGNNTFALFEAFPFVDDPTLMVEEYIHGPGVEEPARIEVNDDPSFETRWPEDEAFKLLGFALQANELVNTRRGIALIGSASDIHEALSTIITRLDPAHRLAVALTLVSTGVSRSPVASGRSELPSAHRSVD